MIPDQLGTLDSSSHEENYCETQTNPIVDPFENENPMNGEENYVDLNDKNTDN